MRHLLLLFFFLILQNFTMAQSKPKLIYFGDPMCSWCYGFSPEISKVKDSLDQKVDFQMIMGGLRPYNTETMVDLGDFLKGHWEEVNVRSGQPFSYDILNDTTFVYDTEPACRSVVLMRMMKPEKEFEFFKKVQYSFYEKNKNTNLTSTFSELAESYGLDKKAFAQKFESDELKQKVREDFNYSNQIGVRGFPTIVLQHGENYYLITNGYQKAEQVLQKIKSILESKD